jgi:hypothetical protein
MLEFGLMGVVIGFLIARRWARSKARRILTLDQEYRELLDTASRTKESASEIRAFLLRVIADERNGIETFNDSQLVEAERILQKIGPGAFFWMTHIATQLAFLSAAQINGLPTNVEVELRGSATAEDVVRVVVQI